MIETVLRQVRPKAKQMYLDPRTKIFLCFTMSIVMLDGEKIGILQYVIPILAIIPLIFMMILKKWKLVVYYTFMYLFCLTIPDLIMPYLPQAVNLLFTGVIAIYTKVLPAMSMFCFMVITTSVSEFVAAMDKLYIPKSFTIPVSVMFRFFPTIREEYTVIRVAMKLRNVGSLRRPWEMLEYRLVPLLIGLVTIGNELSASAMTRGLNAPNKRTNVCAIGFHWQDVAAMLFCIIALGIFVCSLIFKI